VAPTPLILDVREEERDDSAGKGCPGQPAPQCRARRV
jgi:hypothetical protein